MKTEQLHLFPPLEHPTPTVTAAERVASLILDAIEAIDALIPHLEAPHPSTASHTRGARTVSRGFIRSMIVIAEETPELRGLGIFDADEARAMLQFRDAFRPVAQRVAHLLASINYTMESRKAQVASQALTAYHVLKSLARDPESLPLTGRVEILRRDLARKNGTTAHPHASAGHASAAASAGTRPASSSACAHATSSSSRASTSSTVVRYRSASAMSMSS